MMFRPILPLKLGLRSEMVEFWIVLSVWRMMLIFYLH